MKYFIVYIWQGSEYTTVSNLLRKRYTIDGWRDSEYPSGSEFTRILKMSGLRKVLKKWCITDAWQDSEYLSGSEYGRVSKYVRISQDSEYKVPL